MILRGSVFSKILEMETGITVIIPNAFKEDNKYQVTFASACLFLKEGNNCEVV